MVAGTILRSARLLVIGGRCCKTLCLFLHPLATNGRERFWMRSASRNNRRPFPAHRRKDDSMLLLSLHQIPQLSTSEESVVCVGYRAYGGSCYKRLRPGVSCASADLMRPVFIALRTIPPVRHAAEIRERLSGVSTQWREASGQKPRTNGCGVR
jgi:hypothetical protein